MQSISTIGLGSWVSKARNKRATMSHEIRTPMNGVLGMVEVLERQGLNEAQQQTVSTIRRNQAVQRKRNSPWFKASILDFGEIENIIDDVQ
jgi:signal transduction histidine kinase